MRIPVATYRLQLTPDFGFSHARAILPYLRDLGITDLYASPIFQARKGSLHGYDIVDPNKLNSELGTVQEFEALMEKVREHEMGWIQDIVPNHMAFDGQNSMLMDVLENGRASPFFDFFDIDWNHPYENMKDKVLAPFLGNFYGECLENGEIKLHYDQRGVGITYSALRFPAHIESYGTVFTHGLNGLRKKLRAHHPDFVKLLGVLYALKNLPPNEESRERAEQIKFVKSMLWELYSSSDQVREFIDANVARFNGTKGNPESFNLLDQFLSEQLYRLSFWKVAAEELNYRRFFNVNELISLRMDDQKVFYHTHALIFKLVREGKITGLRIDHIDGLYDPLTYLKRIRQELGDIHVSVEKILALDESLPESWPVEGTTGYDFLNYVGGIFCNHRNERKFTRIYARHTSCRAPFAEIISEKKRLIIGRYMAGDIEGLAHLLKSISSRDRHAADVTLYGIKRALVEVLTFFPVYRSYVNRDTFSDYDRLLLKKAVQKAREVNPGLLLEINFIERFLLLEFQHHTGEEGKEQWRHFVMRFQQLTGPLMAKGFEDTALYVYNRLLSLNNVGGNPDKFGITADEFHRFNRRRRERWPCCMNATATHDTKRGEDVSARINVISELPEEWERNIKAWSKLNREKKTVLAGEEVPDRNDEYFLYQTLIGAFPLRDDGDFSFVERLKAYVIKAVREAKVHTGWLKPDAAYEQAYVNFVEEILEASEANQFLNDFAPFTKKIAYYGMFNSLSQTLLKMVAPGVPDFYQGAELWDLSLVDPDNRRPVDFVHRAKLIKEIKSAESKDPSALRQGLLSEWQDGRIKLYLIYKVLNFRRAHSELFLGGDYIPLAAFGEMGKHVCAFARHNGDVWAVTVVPRMIAKLVAQERVPLGEEVWRSTALRLPGGAPDHWRNVLTGEHLDASVLSEKKVLPLRSVFRDFPVALLAGSPGSSRRI